MDNDNLALRPNCLLTKCPLVFITGIRSLFYYETLGSELQKHVKAHGYQVLSPIMPFRNHDLRHDCLQNWLSQQEGKKFHFFLSPTSYFEFSSILEKYKSSTVTLSTQLKNQFTDGFWQTPTLYHLHKLLCFSFGAKAELFSELFPDKSVVFLDRFLDHCIELAENENL